MNYFRLCLLLSFCFTLPVRAEADTPREIESEVVAALKQWAAAWSGRHVDAYFACYMPNYLPPNGSKHSDWIRQRKSALEKPARITLHLDDVRSKISNDSHVSLIFRQTYRSESLQDVSFKKLDWEKVDGQWRITREESLP
jgi:hypothetical protein